MSKWIYSFLTLVLVSLISVSGWISPEVYTLLFEENGIVEVLSAAGYFFAFVLMLAHVIGRKIPAGWSLCALTLCFGLRELDFDKRFTTMGIFKSRFYSSSEVMLGEKLIGVLVVLLLLTCLYYVVKTFVRPWLQNLKARNPVAISIFLAFAMMAIAKSLDGLPRKLKPFGIKFDHHDKMMFEAWEESLELMVPLFMITAIITLIYRARRASKQPTAAGDR
ncbi:MAG: hypothetical protein FJ220_01285 [Kiritimatiellaceae bacterium]|nr:hypothetical protein [Kiritimatiellaceae bacterium]